MFEYYDSVNKIPENRYKVMNEYASIIQNAFRYYLENKNKEQNQEIITNNNNQKSTKEGIETQILEDVHAPNKIRVNGVLSSIDKFYEVYDIKEGDKMYVPKEERVGLW